MPQTPGASQPDFDDVRRRADEFARQAYAEVFERIERPSGGLAVTVPIVSAIEAGVRRTAKGPSTDPK
jgi:hypothetical protein